MSARDYLLEFSGEMHPRLAPELEKAVDFYRAEVLREVAESIRENFAYCEDPNGTNTCCGVSNVLTFIHSEAERGSASPEATET